MSFFDLTGLSGITDVLGKLIDLFPNAKDKQEALQKLQDWNAQIQLGQMEIDKTEAASTSLFVSGWRPACGWLCVAALGYATIVSPIFRLPAGDLNTLIMILGGMLGLGGLRTAEKIKGVK